ncbi:MAG: hypothetical protein HEQ17_09710 [Limnohabitans sp.]|jgi:hypothetical protein|uniref:hypothetical protein n=1 Tax=Limnohabitans sp. TaxID=1907725 RepID=UPI0025DA25B7|nr:hypothetical protein [Limnohabitans sp.]MCO4089197.1 hypothetical protein [Limnohabitans sp.]
MNSATGAGPDAVHFKTSGAGLQNTFTRDLEKAVSHALRLPRQEARRRAEAFGWPHTVALFKSYLMPIKGKGKKA